MGTALMACHCPSLWVMRVPVFSRQIQLATVMCWACTVCFHISCNAKCPPLQRSGARCQAWVRAGCLIEIVTCLQEAVDRGVFKLQMSPSAPPDVPVILTTATEIASGMAFLHEHGIVHGDLTGGMILCI